MNKKFKNKFAVTGSKHLLKAFAEELKEIGYKQYSDITTFEKSTHITTFIDGNYVVGFNNSYCIEYNLPQDWDMALELAEETEEVIPEYVKYIDTKFKGDVVKVLDWKCSSYCKVEHHKEGILQPFKHLVIPATKEEYEAQFKLYFGDKEVTIGKRRSICGEIWDTVVECAGEVGTLEQVQAIVDFIERLDSLKFGKYSIQTVEDVKGLSSFRAFNDDCRIKIGCSYGTLAQAKKILEAGNKLK